MTLMHNVALLRQHVLSQPLTPEYQHRAETDRLRNFDIFDFALNGVQ